VQSPIHLPLLPAARPTCTLCSLHSGGARSVGIPTCYIPGSLPLSQETPCVLFLGQNPGFNEDTSGTPFIGKSGAMVQDSFIAGISLHTLASVFVGNTARCYHVTGDGPTNKHYKVCRDFLLPDLRLLAMASRELIVVCLGAPATSHLYALLGRPKVSLTSAFTHQGTRLPLPSEESLCPKPLSPKGRRSKKVKSTGPVSEEDSLFAKVISATSPSTTVATESAPKPSLMMEDAATSAAASPTESSSKSSASSNDGRGSDILVFHTFHPAAVMRSNNLIHAVAGHLQLLLNHLTGHTPVPSSPQFVVPFSPRT